MNPGKTVPQSVGELPIGVRRRKTKDPVAVSRSAPVLTVDKLYIAFCNCTLILKTRVQNFLCGYQDAFDTFCTFTGLNE